MGSFYTQVLVRENDEQRYAEVMRSLGRRSYVIPAQNGISVVCDKESETQQIEILDSVALTLSARLDISASAGDPGSFEIRRTLQGLGSSVGLFSPPSQGTHWWEEGTS